MERPTRGTNEIITQMGNIKHFEEIQNEGRKVK
jgi:hypothetical protein